MLEAYCEYNHRSTTPKPANPDIIEINKDDFINLNGIEVDVQYISDDDRVKLRETYK